MFLNYLLSLSLPKMVNHFIIELSIIINNQGIKMGILDNLKEQADKDISKKLNEELSTENAEYVYNTRIAPKMKMIYFYFKEFTQHLNAIESPVKVATYSKQLPKIGELHQADYRVNSDATGGVVNPDEIQEILLRYNYKGQAVKEYIHHTDSKVESDSVTKILTKAKMQFSTANNLASSNNGALIFYIAKVVMVSFKFKIHPTKANISLDIKNHENFEERSLTINPDDVDEAYLDKLARYILRKDSEFLKIDIDDDVRIQIRQRIEAEKKAKQAEREKEAALQAEQETTEKGKSSSLFGKLFKK